MLLKTGPHESLDWSLLHLLCKAHYRLCDNSGLIRLLHVTLQIKSWPNSMVDCTTSASFSDYTIKHFWQKIFDAKNDHLLLVPSFLPENRAQPKKHSTKRESIEPLMTGGKWATRNVRSPRLSLEKQAHFSVCYVVVSSARQVTLYVR